MTFLMDTNDTGGTFQPVPAGIHAAVCIFVADLGMQVGQFGPKATLLFTFEIPALLAGDGKPMQISRRFGKTLAEKSALRPFLQSWLGAPLAPGQLDIATLAGRPAMLVVSQSQSGERVYSNVTTAAPVAPGTAIPAPSFPPLCYGPGRDPAVFAALPEWIRKAITAGGAAPAGALVPAAPMPHAAAYPPAGYAAPMPAYPAPAAVPTAGYAAPTQVAAPVPMPAAAAVSPALNAQTAHPITPDAPFNDALNF